MANPDSLFFCGGPAFFGESILRAYRHAFRFLQICENSCCAPAMACISDGLLYVFMYVDRFFVIYICVCL